MARKSLRPYLNQIRAWSREGRTDAWVAHQLEVSVQEIQQFKRQNALTAGPEEGAGGPPSPTEEVDMRAADEALIAEELEAAERAGVIGTPADQEEAEEGTEPSGAAAQAEGEEDEGAAVGAEQTGAEGEEEGQGGRASARGRRRTRRGGARRSTSAPARFEGTFDHGEEGYGLWLDPAVRDNPVYAEHWAGHRPIEVVIEEDQILIRRLGEESQE